MNEEELWKEQYSVTNKIVFGEMTICSIIQFGIDRTSPGNKKD